MTEDSENGTGCTLVPAKVDAALLHGDHRPLDQHPALVYLGRLAPGSRRTMQHALTVIAHVLTRGRCTLRTLAWPAVRYQHVAAVRQNLAESYKAATVNKALAALRGVLKECWRLGLMAPDDYQRAADVSGVKCTTEPTGRALSGGELQAIFAACADDPRPSGPRDAALVAVLYAAGLRRSEAVALDLADYDRDTGALRIRHGKGNKARTVFATNGAADALNAWIEVRGDDAGPIFVPVNKGGRIIKHRMSDQSILLVLRRRGRQAACKRFTPHDLRRTCITDLLAAGANIVAVKNLAGHESVQTTAKYDRSDENAKRRAAELLHVPFVRRPTERPTKE